MCNLADPLETGVCFTSQKCADFDGIAVGGIEEGCNAPTPKQVFVFYIKIEICLK